jgi:hypothetical protein
LRFNFRLKLANLTLFLMASHTQALEGVTSIQQDGTHKIMWDLDKCTLKQATTTLRKVQKKHCLSNIFIVSDAEGSYRAFCYNRVNFKHFLKVLLDTDFIDWNFFYWTVSRGKATLRTSSKKGREPQKVVKVLRSYPAKFPSSCLRAHYETGVNKRGMTLLLGD